MKRASFLFFILPILLFAGKEEMTQRVMETPISHHVLERYQRDYGGSFEEAASLEKELKRFFVIAKIYSDETVPMCSSAVDHLWHTFILFTQEYAHFCESALGSFIHHKPRTSEDTTTLEEHLAKKQKFSDLYEKVFGEFPSLQIWNLIDAECAGTGRDTSCGA